MKSFFLNIWKYLALLFAGVIGGMIAAIKLIEKPSILNVNAENFIAEQTHKIGKLKQKGEGNSLSPVLPTPKEKRLVRRTKKRESRLKKETEKEDQQQKQE
ncbi:MAG TPA: hypothetical protein DHV48_01125 [Prolixibacteraceae bacterium]|nr:hypothetical protein [Prolixibacteraceae bacterium]